MAMSLQERMIYYRAKEKITQKELAERCGLSKDCVSLIERGKEPSKITKAKIEIIIGNEN